MLRVTRVIANSSGIPPVLKTQRQVQRGAGIFPMFGKHAYGVRRHAEETSRLAGAHKWGQAQRWDMGERLPYHSSVASFRGWFGKPQFKCSCGLRRSHLALRDAPSLSLATAQQPEPPN